MCRHLLINSQITNLLLSTVMIFIRPAWAGPRLTPIIGLDQALASVHVHYIQLTVFVCMRAMSTFNTKAGYLASSEYFDLNYLDKKYFSLILIVEIFSKKVKLN